jgi:hypothetical protein
MGIFIKLDIVPNKINIIDWNSTFGEAEQLIKAYPFLDIVCDEDSYDCSWHYADSPLARPINYCNNNIGFRMCGDLISMETAESFELIKDFHYYRRGNQESSYEGQDILQLYADNMEEIVSVFNDKTQGYDYHQYILAIACLFEDRLKPYALVHGDVSKGQMQEAIEWANNILKKPIQISERANNILLLARIKKIMADELTTLNMFMDATLNDQNLELGYFIKTNFNKEFIIKYYTEKMSQYNIGTLGFSKILNIYLNLGNDLKDLCDICINKDSKADSIAIFIKKIFNLGIYLEPQDIVRLKQEQLGAVCSFQSDNPQSTTPDTIGSLFGKIFYTMQYGNICQNNIYISLEQLAEIFKEKFGDFCNVDAIINEYFSEIDKKPEPSSKDRVTSSLINKQEHTLIEKYDIESLDNLIFWEVGFTILPKLENFILTVKEFMDKNIPESIKDSLQKFSNSNKKDRMKYLINHNKHFLISKKSWAYIEAKVNDFNFFRKVARILLIDANEIKINRLVLSLLNNTMLFEKYLMN